MNSKISEKTHGDPGVQRLRSYTNLSQLFLAWVRERMSIFKKSPKIITFRVIFFICTISCFSQACSCDARRRIHRDLQGMTIAELLSSRLSPTVTPLSPVPGYSYQYQHPRHLQDAIDQHIKPAYQNKSPDSFIRFPLQVFNYIVAFENTVFNDIVSNPV